MVLVRLDGVMGLALVLAGVTGESNNLWLKGCSFYGRLFYIQGQGEVLLLYLPLPHFSRKGGKA